MADLVTLAEFKDYKNFTNSEEDTPLGEIITYVSQFVKSYCRRSFIDYYSTDKTDYFDGTNTNFLILPEFPIVSITSVKTSNDGETFTDYEDYFIDYRIDAIRTASSSFVASIVPFNSVEVIYKAGYDVLPDDLKLATLDLVEFYRHEEFTPRKSFQATVVENLGFREGSGIALPSHIKRTLEMHKAD